MKKSSAHDVTDDTETYDVAEVYQTECASEKQEENVANIPPKKLSVDDKLIALISSQQYDGSFKLDAGLCQLLDSSVEDARKGREILFKKLLLADLLIR